MKNGLIRSEIEQEKEKIDVRPLLLVHDEIVWEVKVCLNIDETSNECSK